MFLAVLKKLTLLGSFIVVVFFYFTCSSKVDEVKIIKIDKSKINSIVVFNLPNQYEPTVYNEEEKTIKIVLDETVSLTQQNPTIVTSNGSKVFPKTKEPVDFSSGPVEYTVTAENGTIQKYMVTVVNKTIINKNIPSFLVNGQIGATKINNDTNIIEIEIPEGFLSTRLKPIIEIPANTTLEPQQGKAVDFTRGAKYVVTSTADNKTKTYLVRIVKKPTNCAKTVYVLDELAKHYEFVEENKTWEEAEICANKRGGYLTNINDLNENKVVRDFAVKIAVIPRLTSTDGGNPNIPPKVPSAPYIWLGGQEKGGGRKGNWEWTQGNVVFSNDNGGGVNGNFVNWAGGNATLCYSQPGGFSSGIGDKVALALTNHNPTSTCNVNSDGKWGDFSGSNKLYYMIEYDQDY